MTFDSIASLQAGLHAQNYITDRGLAVTIFLALKLGRPLFLEGEAGVGKTEVAKVLAAALDTPLIRLQCYEGLDIHHAVYEWNYTRQMMHIRLLEARGEKVMEADLFSKTFLLERPLLQAISSEQSKPPVLLIDEIDRSDAEFEAFLLEVLSDFQISIPEIGTIRAKHPPIVVLTSNRTREIHDALKRRCLYAWIDYPSFEKELAILTTKVPDAPARLSKQVAAYVGALREADLYKLPGISESLDWLRALHALDKTALDPVTIEETLGALLKYQDDMQLIREQAAELLRKLETG